MRWEVKVLRCYFLLTTESPDFPGCQEEGGEDPAFRVRSLW
jgi:hypothetical protein